MIKDKFLLSIIIGTILIFAIGIALAARSQNTPELTKANAQAVASETGYDWGTIDMNDGNVEKTFTLINEGEDTLELANVKTSCACTNAIITVKGEKSPEFGMHTVSSWIGEVAPSEEAQVEIIFDPAYHGPQGVGAITRQISMETNDENNPVIEFNLTANVTNE